MVDVSTHGLIGVTGRFLYQNITLTNSYCPVVPWPILWSTTLNFPVLPPTALYLPPLPCCPLLSPLQCHFVTVRA